MTSPVQRPKLVVGLVVDQMRWDYLYRFYDRYASDGGFRRLIDQGFSCENTFISYIPTYTACGHTSLYTGSVPAVHGITGNSWWDKSIDEEMYCTGDSNVHTVGGTSAAGEMSPRNMLVTTVCDELRMATNFRSKVIGIAIKDRGGILPAGHAANAAYWYETASGNWISSTYYMQDLPQWVKAVNARKLPDQYFKKGWNTLYPISTYIQSTTPDQQHAGKQVWPYNYEAYVGKDYGKLSATPYGNTFTKEMAIAAVTGEELGKDNFTDFLTVSFSSTDYVGHANGPNSVEIEDTYLRLDKDLGEFFRFLDEKVGKGQYLVFLSADHAVSHSTDFAGQRKIPGGGISFSSLMKKLNAALSSRFGSDKLIRFSYNNQLFYDHHLIDSLKINETEVSKLVIAQLAAYPGIYRAFETSQVMNTPLPEKIRSMTVNGYFPMRSGDIQILLKSGYMQGGGAGTTHGSWNPYDSHIPLLWYGWKVKPGKMNRETYVTDVAPTIAAMLNIQMPSGCIGTAIGEVTGN